ncbi:acyl-CoA dehydrogenase family protein [Amycolatopsis jejuensis]|uniref:acyl-CoA dehydrogenase family protein n=1 Tax=Amycolatopsis jejuensis TaxID=330084 RepID=UPI000524D996|nr:acyl-CoA dehydrogenase family protein [Amycolatopsis jejuensis]
MELGLTDEQKLLATTVDTLLRKRYDPETRHALLGSPGGWSREMWQRYAELGLLGLGVDERYGGAGTGLTEIAVVMETFGRHLVLEPFLPTVVRAGQLVAAAGSAAQKELLLPRITRGELLMAWAHTERATRPVARAVPAADGWRLSGEKIAVTGGDSAEVLVVTAHRPDGKPGLFLVDAAATRQQPYRMHDGHRGADIRLDDTVATALGTGTDVTEVIETVLDATMVALCAEAVGAMDRMLELTVGYLKSRAQFGHPIGTFQVLRHRAADMYLSLEQARSMALLARLAADGPSDARRRAAVRAAKIQVDLSARHIGHEAVQLHGGIGMTDEYPVCHYFKRTTVIARLAGDLDALVTGLGEQGGLIPAG